MQISLSAKYFINY